MPIFVASFPGLPIFCSLVSIQYTEAEEVRKMGKAWEHLSCDMDGRWAGGEEEERGGG